MCLFFVAKKKKGGLKLNDTEKKQENPNIPSMLANIAITGAGSIIDENDDQIHALNNDNSEKAEQQAQQLKKTKEKLNAFKSDRKARKKDFEDMQEKRETYMAEQQEKIKKAQKAQKEKHQTYQSQERKLSLEEKEQAQQLIKKMQLNTQNPRKDKCNDTIEKPEIKETKSESVLTRIKKALKYIVKGDMNNEAK